MSPTDLVTDIKKEFKGDLENALLAIGKTQYYYTLKIFLFNCQICQLALQKQKEIIHNDIFRVSFMFPYYSCYETLILLLIFENRIRQMEFLKDFLMSFDCEYVQNLKNVNLL